MSEMKVQKRCTVCSGSGYIDNPPPGDTGVTCPSCNGAGSFEWNIEATDLFDKLDDIMGKLDDILAEVQGG